MEQGGHVIVGEGESIADGRRFLAESESDLLIIDLTFTDGEAEDLIREWRRKKPDSKIIAFTMHGAPYVIKRTVDAGVHGYIHKMDHLSCLYSAIKEVDAGQIFYSPATRELLEKNGNVNPMALIGYGIKFSPTEDKILDRLGEGLGRKEISKDQGIAIQTVESHLRRAKEKLGLSSRRDLIRFAINRKKNIRDIE